MVISPISEPSYRQLSFLRFSNTFDVIFASISAMRPQGDGMMLGTLSTLPVS
jgi:hypothetical protein